LLVFVGRTALGVGLALVFSMVGVGVAWGLYVFSSSTSWTGLLILFTSVGGIGAGVGCYIAWLRIDTRLGLSDLTAGAALIGVGVGGAWGGYQFGSVQVADCCADPEISPISHAILGATVLTNATMLTYVAVGRALKFRY